MGNAQDQAGAWGGAPEDWTTLQEPNHIPLWTAMLGGLDVHVGTRVLDAACGGGGASVLAAARGAAVAGIDATPGLVEIARRRVPEGAFVVGDIETLPYPDGAFDAVLAANAVQFSADRVATLRGFARVCGAGARIAIGNFGPPDDVAFAAVLAAIRSALPEPSATRGPFELSMPGALEAIIDEAELRIVESDTVDCPFTYDDVETCLRAVLSGGPMQAAVAQVGPGPVREAVRSIAERYRGEDGRVVIGPNPFRYVVVER